MRMTDVGEYDLCLGLPGHNLCLSSLTSNAVEMLGDPITTLKTQMNIKCGKHLKTVPGSGSNNFKVRKL